MRTTLLLTLSECRQSSVSKLDTQKCQFKMTTPSSTEAVVFKARATSPVEP